jgi:hypothetical protein
VSPLSLMKKENSYSLSNHTSRPTSKPFMRLTEDRLVPLGHWQDTFENIFVAFILIFIEIFELFYVGFGNIQIMQKVGGSIFVYANNWLWTFRHYAYS